MYYVVYLCTYVLLHLARHKSVLVIHYYFLLLFCVPKRNQILHQTKVLAFRSNNNRSFPNLNKQHINSNTFEMYHHGTILSGFVLFYLMKSILTSYNFNGSGSSDMPSIPFESPERSLSSNIFKLLEDSLLLEIS